MGDEVEKRLLGKVNRARRAALKKLLLGSAFTVPVIASFAMSGLSTTAMASNQSNQVPTLAEWEVPVLGAALVATAAVVMSKKKRKDG